MPKSKTAAAFTCTREQHEKLLAVIKQYKDQPGAAMPVLQEAQDIFGYLPAEVQTEVAEGLGMSLSEVYGIVSFYTQFSLTPKGKTRVDVCMGTACYVRNAGEILARIERKLGCAAGEVTEDGAFSIDATRCIGACGLAPVIVVGGDVYGRLHPDDVDGILDKYMK